MVTNAYARLFAEGWLEGRHGSGTFVADAIAPNQWLSQAPEPASSKPAASLGVDEVEAASWSAHGQRILIDLQPGISWAEDTVSHQGGVPLRLLGDTVGMHVVLELPDDYPTDRLIEAAAERGIAVYPLTRYFAGSPTINGLILGYGTATVPQVRTAATELAGLLTRLPRGQAVSDYQPLGPAGYPPPRSARTASRAQLVGPVPAGWPYPLFD